MINLNRLLIKINDGTYGIDLEMKKGLNLIIGENQVGKSTIINSIFYALGLESLLGYTNERALKPSVRDLLKDDEKEIKIYNSYVVLEIENKEKQIITLKRSIKQEEYKKNDMIKVYYNKIEDITSETKFIEYYLRKDSYIKENGFFNFLEKYLKIKLPKVEKYDENYTKLYFENIFSAFFIEQTIGWSDFLNSSPGFYGIKQHKQKAIEFILGLDTNDIILRKTELKKQKKELEKKWELTNQLLKKIMKNYFIELSFDYLSYKEFLKENSKNIKINLVGNLIDINDYIHNLNLQLNEIKAKNISSITIEDNDKIIEEYSEKIRVSQQLITDLQCNENILKKENFELELQLKTTENEILKIELERQVFKDIERLKNSGSNQGVKFEECPYCSNNLPLNTFSKDIYTMNIEENKKFVEEKSKLLQATKQILVRELEFNKNSIESTRKEQNKNINELKILNSELPKISIQKDLFYKEFSLNRQLEEIIEAKKNIVENFTLKKDLAKKIDYIEKELENLPNDNISEKTKKIIERFQNKVKEYLKAFDFKSIDIDRIHIPLNNYFPKVENFDIRLHISASDFIRLQWAYYISLVECSILYPKILILDEPGQQNVSMKSIKMLFEKLNESKNIQSIVSYAIDEKTESEVTYFLTKNKIEYTPINKKSIKKFD